MALQDTVPTKNLALEAILPQAVAEGWSSMEVAKRAKVSQPTALNFLHDKVKQASVESRKQIFKLSAHAGAIFDGVIARQMRRLEALEHIEDGKWTAADFKLEKHVISLLGPLIKWTQFDIEKGGPKDNPPAQLSDGL